MVWCTVGMKTEAAYIGHTELNLLFPVGGRESRPEGPRLLLQVARPEIGILGLVSVSGSVLQQQAGLA